jgi:hypothetical protein
VRSYLLIKILLSQRFLNPIKKETALLVQYQVFKMMKLANQLGLSQVNGRVAC